MTTNAERMLDRLKGMIADGRIDLKDLRDAQNMRKELAQSNSSHPYLQTLDEVIEWMKRILTTDTDVPRRAAQFEVTVDGHPRSYRNIKGDAIELAEYLKRLHPHSEVKVTDLQTGEIAVAAYKPRKR